MIKNGEMAMIINTTDSRRASVQDSYSIRRSALQARITYYTTVAGARAACAGMQQMQELRAYSVQGLHRRLASGPTRRA
jgi:carbamoyl-phosphate synthase large subunit